MEPGDRPGAPTNICFGDLIAWEIHQRVTLIRDAVGTGERLAEVSSHQLALVTPAVAVDVRPGWFDFDEVLRWLSWPS
jgi:hypothetical protein